jgi:hypothetical protein
MEITTDLAGLLAAFGGAVLAVWWRIETRIKEEGAAARAAAEAARKLAERAAKDLGDYKLEAMARYATAATLKETEERLVLAIERLTNQMERLPDRLFALVRESRGAAE